MCADRMDGKPIDNICIHRTPGDGASPFDALFWRYESFLVFYLLFESFVCMVRQHPILGAQFGSGVVE